MKIVKIALDSATVIFAYLAFFLLDEKMQLKDRIIVVVFWIMLVAIVHLVMELHNSNIKIKKRNEEIKTLKDNQKGLTINIESRNEEFDKMYSTLSKYVMAWQGIGAIIISANSHLKEEKIRNIYDAYTYLNRDYIEIDGGNSSGTNGSYQNHK